VWWCHPANDECVQGSHLDDGLQIGAGAVPVAGEGPCDLKALGLRAGIAPFAADGFGLQNMRPFGTSVKQNMIQCAALSFSCGRYLLVLVVARKWGSGMGK